MRARSSSTYPNANTTTYFITTCVDDPCLSAVRIPNIVEYRYEADVKIALLRITIDREDGTPRSIQASCQIAGIEEAGEIHYSRTDEGSITQFLLNEDRCPTARTIQQKTISNKIHVITPVPGEYLQLFEESKEMPTVKVILNSYQSVNASLDDSLEARNKYPRNEPKALITYSVEGKLLGTRPCAVILNLIVDQQNRLSHSEVVLGGPFSEIIPDPTPELMKSSIDGFNGCVVSK